ncbi:hypothetical protein JCGZ_05959 [Jatropha curcas]|uniref:Uncharacterized protein n=1 Tax=Jatropha curcas TaxID=180498 RepID=A0A067KZ27_JATCU|nr:hypothetical protein JCGZ_05959 [Jatropha curcas]
MPITTSVLVDLSLLREYDWGGAFMASMYLDMSQYSHCIRTGLGGLGFSAFPSPVLTRDIQWEIPAMSHFQSALIERYVRENHLILRRRFNELSIAQEMTHSRVLLRCRVIRSYYLGKRVYHQVMGLYQIPTNPLVDMLDSIGTMDQAAKSGEAEPEEEFNVEINAETIFNVVEGLGVKFGLTGDTLDLTRTSTVVETSSSGRTAHFEPTLKWAQEISVAVGTSGQVFLTPLPGRALPMRNWWRGRDG